MNEEEIPTLYNINSDTAMFHITLSSEFAARCPEYRGAALYATVANTPFCEELWQEIDAFLHELQSDASDIRQHPAIAATREAYKRCGKDPSRYRPSAEALRRRIQRGLSLYRIDTLVDLVNLVSLRTGYSIGGFDADKIQGTHLELGIGLANESFEGIGRGSLNIEGLPVFRDAIGGIGTPTSDHERTKMGLGTTHILALINGYSGSNGLARAAQMMNDLLQKYASAHDIRIDYFV